MSANSGRKLVLTVNGGSSSIKSATFAAGRDWLARFHLTGDGIGQDSGFGAQTGYAKKLFRFFRDKLVDCMESIRKHGADRAGESETGFGI